MMLRHGRCVRTVHRSCLFFICVHNERRGFLTQVVRHVGKEPGLARRNELRRILTRAAAAPPRCEATNTRCFIAMLRVRRRGCPDANDDEAAARLTALAPTTPWPVWSAPGPVFFSNTADSQTRARLARGLSWSNCAFRVLPPSESLLVGRLGWWARPRVDR